MVYYLIFGNVLDNLSPRHQPVTSLKISDRFKK